MLSSANIDKVQEFTAVDQVLSGHPKSTVEFCLNVVSLCSSDGCNLPSELYKETTNLPSDGDKFTATLRRRRLALCF